MVSPSLLVLSAAEEVVLDAVACWYLSCDPQKVALNILNEGISLHIKTAMCKMTLLASGLPRSALQYNETP